ncbi:MAG: diguanylate cyclase domain-containing protein, partial [Frankiaceae bacterium]
MNPAADAVVPVEAFARLATAVVLTDLSGRITFWNDAAETLFGALGPRAQGCCRAERTGFPWWPAPHTDRAAIVRSGRVWSGELPAGRRDLSDGADGVDRADRADGADGVDGVDDVDGADRADGTDIVASVLQAGLFSPAGELTGVVHVVTGVTGCGGACCEQPREDEPFRTIVQAADLGLGLVDVDGTIRYANPRLAELTGRPANTLAGMSVLRLLDPPGQQAVLAAVARRRAGVADGYHVECRRPDGELKCLHVLGAPVQAFDGRVTGSVVVVADETDQRRAEAELTRLALHDPLTGLPNRATLNDRLTQALARRRRANTVLAVLFADLDRFKTVNDRLGHAVGDEVLRGVAARLAGALRPGDTVARLGGDEFIVLCEELSDPDDVVEIAQRLQAALAPPIVVHSEEILISASIGVVVAALQWPIDPAELLHEADLAMYRAKSRGCGRYEIVTGPGAAPGRDWSARIAALRDAL